MPDRIYTYIDGESHFIRLGKAWKELHGENAQLNELRFKDDAGEELILHVPRAKVFWTRRWSPGQRAMYFTAVSGDAAAVHDVKTALRSFALEPFVVHERKELASQRQALLKKGGVIEKAKTVDAMIIVRMLEDAHRDLYDLCNLYTSDVDYLPVIEAVRNHGKRVYVHGFKCGLAQHSPLEHAPDQFINLTDLLKAQCRLRRTPGNEEQ